MSTAKKPALVWIRCSPQQPCQFCEQGDHQCSVSECGRVATCYRGDGNGRGRKKRGANGTTFWWFPLKPGSPDRGPTLRVVPARKGAKRADVETLDRIYRDVLSCTNMKLTDVHRQALAKRGFPEGHADRLGYGSISSQDAWKVAEGFAQEFGEKVLLEVPGFYLKERNDGSKVIRMAGKTGLLIPVRDVEGRIVSVLSGPDDRQPKYYPLSSSNEKKGNGPGPGSPAHVPLGIERPAKIVRVTEGALKADLAQALGGSPTIGIQGVSSWKPAIPALQALGATTARVAFDADWHQKPEVAEALVAFADALRGAGFDVEIETWDPAHGKGIDDVLAAGHPTRVASGEDVGSILLEAERISNSKDSGSGRTQAKSPIDGKAIAGKVWDVIGAKGETASALFRDKALLADLGRLRSEDPDEYASLCFDLKRIKGFSIKDFKDAVERNAASDQSRSADPDGASGDEEDSDDDVLMGQEENPHRLARGFISEKFYRPDPSCPDGLRLRTYQDELFYWKNSTYRPLPDGELKAMISTYVDADFLKIYNNEMMRWNLKARSGNGGQAPRLRNVTTRLVGDVLQAIKGETLLEKDDYPEVPCWLRPDQEWAADEVLATPNALVHLPSLVAGKPFRRKPTPAYFNRNALGYDFDPAAPKPVEWLQFLDSIWPDDPESVRALQEWLGLLLVPDTSYQKMIAIIGPRRCGKGTICRIAKMLVGRGNVVNPKLAQLATNFGLQPLIGKTAAIITDAKLSGRTDQAAIIETLLSISGEDDQTIDRKNREAWNGKLAARFMIVGNQFPKIKDSSEALPGRFVILQLKRSFYGKEDKALTNKLLRELPGILLWAIKGWERLRERGHFIQPTSAADLVESIAEIANPIGSFLDECTEEGPSFSVPRPELYARWQSWNKEKGREYAGSEESFGVELRTAIPDLKTSQPTIGGKRIRCYGGIQLLVKGRATSPACRWLKAYMSRGRSRQRDVIQAAESEHMTPASVFQAAREIGLVEDKVDQKKYWSLPPDTQEHQSNPY